MNYWPGTNIPKSSGNAFTDWKDGRPSIFNTKNWKQSYVGQQNSLNPDKKQIMYSIKKK